jgi:hypothetical protein
VRLRLGQEAEIEERAEMRALGPYIPEPGGQGMFGGGRRRGGANIPATRDRVRTVGVISLARDRRRLRVRAGTAVARMRYSDARERASGAVKLLIGAMRLFAAVRRMAGRTAGTVDGPGGGSLQMSFKI